MAIALISSATAGSADGTDVTTSAIDTTGATLFVIVVGYDGDSTNYGTISDSSSNSWTFINVQAASNAASVAMFYCAGPTTSASHTFTDTAGFNQASITVYAFSGTATSSVLDQQNGNLNEYGGSIQPGSVTPSQNNELIVTGVSVYNSTGTFTIDSGFSTPLGVLSNSTGNFNAAIDGSYLIQTTAGAVNPTWSYSGYYTIASVIATFKAASAPSGQIFMGWLPQYN